MGSFVRNMKVGTAVVGLLAAGAAAQDQDFSKPLARTKNKSAEGAASSQTRIMSQDGDDQYELIISNGEVTAKVNGKKVPSERVRRSKDKVEILDKDGDVLKSFEISTADGTPWRGGRTAVGGFSPDMPKPKVMIGITMSDDEDGILVDHVYEGLPAEKAGLAEGDVIIGVDGSGKLGQAEFREALNKKEPGDKIRVKVKRDGKEKDISVQLQAFDAEKLGQGATTVWRQFPEDMQGMFKNDPEMQKRFQEAMKNVPPNQRTFVWGMGPEGDMRFSPLAGGDVKRAEELHAQMEKKVAELDKKLARINDQMERLEKLIQKLSEKEGSR